MGNADAKIKAEKILESLSLGGGDCLRVPSFGDLSDYQFFFGEEHTENQFREYQLTLSNLKRLSSRARVKVKPFAPKSSSYFEFIRESKRKDDQSERALFASPQRITAEN